MLRPVDKKEGEASFLNTSGPLWTDPLAPFYEESRMEVPFDYNLTGWPFFFYDADQVRPLPALATVF